IKIAKGLGGTADIRFLGDRTDVPEILPAMEVLLVPSKEEPFGRVVIEGMASGITVVGSDNGGIPEIITDGQDGFLRSPEDLDAWVSMVNTILKNAELRKKIGENARRTIEERFAMDDMIKKIADIYFEMLGQGDTPFELQN
ncbi:glycosyltransferase family 4 protein, partial [Thermodesulfobacteriota bacterium]